MNEAEVHELLEKKGAILKGHFLLSSGLHSDVYLQCARVFQYPRLTEHLADEIAGRTRHWRPEVVASPAIGGLLLGYATALALGCRMIFAERVEGAMVFRRGLGVGPGERVLVVEDVVTTGGSVGEVAALVREGGARLVGVAALVDRSLDPPPFPMVSLLRLPAPTYPPEDCPLCREGIPLEAPGSRRAGEA